MWVPMFLNMAILVGAFRRKTQTIVVTFFKTNEVTYFISFINWLELTQNAILLLLALEIEVIQTFFKVPFYIFRHYLTYRGPKKNFEKRSIFFSIFSSCGYCRREYLTLWSPFAIFEPLIWRRLGPFPACYLLVKGIQFTYYYYKLMVLPTSRDL